MSPILTPLLSYFIYNSLVLSRWLHTEKTDKNGNKLNSFDDFSLFTRNSPVYLVDHWTHFRTLFLFNTLENTERKHWAGLVKKLFVKFIENYNRNCFALYCLVPKIYQDFWERDGLFISPVSWLSRQKRMCYFSSIFLIYNAQLKV